MAKKKNKEKKLAKKLLHKYRLVVLNEDTFEEKFAFKLTRLNVFVTVGTPQYLLFAIVNDESSCFSSVVIVPVVLNRRHELKNIKASKNTEPIVMSLMSMAAAGGSPQQSLDCCILTLTNRKS